MRIELTRDASQRPANAFEDRGSCVHDRPSRSASVRSPARTFHDHPPASAVVRHVGCHLGCQVASITFGVARSMGLVWRAGFEPHLAT